MLHFSNLFLFSVLLFILLNKSYVSSMTKEQLKMSGQLAKYKCMSKNDVTEEQVGEISNGKFIEEKNVMCYITCIYKKGQIIKGDKINYDMMIKQVEMLYPTEMKTGAKKAIEHCKVLSNTYKNICELSYWTAKCIYEFNPANFIFA